MHQASATSPSVCSKDAHRSEVYFKESIVQLTWGPVMTVADWTQPWAARAGTRDKNPNTLCWYAVDLCHIIHLLTSAILHLVCLDYEAGLSGSWEAACTVDGCAQPRLGPEDSHDRSMYQGSCYVVGPAKADMNAGTKLVMERRTAQLTLEAACTVAAQAQSR